MIEKLINIEYDELYDEVTDVKIAKTVLPDLSKKPNKTTLASFLIAHYGNELLSQKSIRHLLYYSLTEQKLLQCCKKFNIRPKKHKYDTALLLSQYKWNKTSGAPEILNEALNYDIPDEYMPFYQDTIYLPKIEKVYSNKSEPLFDFQIKVSQQLIEFLNHSTSKRTMIQMPTGSGKTKTTLFSIINYILNNNINNILWLSHTSELCEQSLSSFKKNWQLNGDGLFHIYRLYGNYKQHPYELKDGITFASLQKIYSLLDKDEPLYNQIASRCQVIIFDEAHKALASTYNEIIENIMKRSKTCKLVGLTATPGRGSNKDFELANKQLCHVFDDNLIALTFGKKQTINELINIGVLSIVKRKSIEGLSDFIFNKTEKNFFNQFSDIPPSVLKTLSLNKQRNQNIIESVVKEIKNGKKILIFSCTSEHAHILSTILNLNAVKARSITSDMSKVSRMHTINSFRENKIQCLVNFGILTTGFDAPSIDAVFITRPTNSIILYSQMIGRGLRGPKVGGNEECLLYDVIDNFHDYGNQNEIYDYFDGYWD